MKDKIKLKIQALLAKNTENGATEAEAISALSKAQELMKNYFISEADLEDPFLGEQCVLQSTDLIQSAYITNLFLAELGQLFDCEHYYTKYRIYFFGFKQDSDLCLYFYKLIARSTLSEKDKFLKSPKGKELKQYYSGRSLAASFIKGFQCRIAEKMVKMYQARKDELGRNQHHGLVVAKKKTKVKNAFDQTGVSPTPAKTRIAAIEAEAFDQGEKAGKNFHLTQGIKNSKEESTLKLN